MKMHMECTSEARPGRFASGTNSFILVTSTDSCPACTKVIKFDWNVVILHPVNRNKLGNDITKLAETCAGYFRNERKTINQGRNSRKEAFSSAADVCPFSGCSESWTVSK